MTRPYVIDQLISAKAIAARVEALAREISDFYAGTDKLVVVGLLRGSFVFIADLVVSFKVYRETFASRVTLRPAEHRIDVEYLEGPFRHMRNHWRFVPEPGGACTVDFFVDFEFRSAILQKLIGLVFHEAMLRIVRAFEKRAQALYGRRATA